MTNRLILLAGMTTLALSSICAADSIVVGGKIYTDVYVKEGPSMYYVCIPSDGTIMNVDKATLKEGDLAISQDPLERLALKEAFDENRASLRTEIERRALKEQEEREKALQDKIRAREKEVARQAEVKQQAEQPEQDARRKKAKDEWLHTQPAHTVASLRSEILDYLSQSKDCGQLVSVTASDQVDGKQRQDVVTTTGIFSFLLHRGRIIETNFTPSLRPPTEEVPSTPETFNCLTWTFEVGRKGVVKNMKIVQVVDSHTALLALANLAGEDTVVMVKGCDFSANVDGQYFDTKSPIEVTGTTTYRTALGGTKKVFVLEPCESSPAKDKAIRAASPPQDRTSQKEWFRGGNLHKANVGQWKSATNQNKLATVADWLPGWEGHLNSPSDFDRLKVKAQMLVSAIDDVVTVKGVDSMLVTEMAAAIITLSKDQLGP